MTETPYRLFDDELYYADPDFQLGLLRSSRPVTQVFLPGGVVAWLVTGYESVRHVLGSEDFLKSLDNWRAYQEGHVPITAEIALVSGENMFTTDPPEHTLLRRTMQASFTKRQIDRLRPFINDLTRTLVEQVSPVSGRTVDLMPALCELLPIGVICHLFGVPMNERPQLRWWAHHLFGTDTDAAVKAHAEIGFYLETLVDRKEREASDDLTTALIRASEGFTTLSRSQVADQLRLMLVAGHETTVNLLANSVLTLDAHPFARDLLADDPKKWPKAVEELLRYNTSITNSYFRFARTDTILEGVRIPAGEPVVVSHAAANRDPARWEEPDCFDIEREHLPHITFGYGLHHCLGASLARTEILAALSMLYTRYPGLEVVSPSGGFEWTRSISSRGPRTLPVRLRSSR
ncbi:cytochrome P450 family protein [Amycolatopsis sp. NPDC004378]